jgi:pimeloyl-ACP methyl ester carboxylesterase
VQTIAAERTLLVGFSMGGGVASQVAVEASVETLVGLAPWFPDRLPLDPLRGRRVRVLHGSLDRWLPGIPGVSPASSRRGFERAAALGVEGEYTIIPGAVHGVALRAGARLVPLPRAATWARLVADELRRFSVPAQPG